MSFNTNNLYELLPSIYRLRDAKEGGALRELLDVIAHEIREIEENLDQLYDDQFIETCADWAIPYIGDLVGYRQLHDVSPKTGRPRAEVAKTIAYRRRKGTAAMLEQMARDVTGWPARVVEYFQLLATTQHLQHLRPKHRSTADLRNWEALERLGTPFDSLPRSVDVRRIASNRGKHNIPNVGIFLWRLSSYSLTRSPAFQVDERRYRFNPLGTDTQLFSRPESEEEISHLAEPINVPMPISRRMLETYKESFYGKGKSLYLEGVDALDKIVVCDLSDKEKSGSAWAHTPPESTIAIDPVLGRIAFATPPGVPPLVTFHYGFGMDIGGGEYDRENLTDATHSTVSKLPSSRGTIGEALDKIDGKGAIEIGDSGRYAENLTIQVAEKGHIIVRVASNVRPCLLLGQELLIDGNESDVTLDGLLIQGGPLRVRATAEGGELKRLCLRHCTLRSEDGASLPNLIVETSGTTVEIDHCIIVGGLRVAKDASVRIKNSIVDATSETAVAYAGWPLLDKMDGGKLHVENSTIIGNVHTSLLELASNSIFLADKTGGDNGDAPIRSDRLQEGCVRFSWLPWTARVPRRYRCHPASEKEANRVRPIFTSLRYGDPGYCQLSLSCAEEIRRGADDEAEMGAFHDLFQSQKESNLRVRLDEYLRFGLEAGIFYAN